MENIKDLKRYDVLDDNVGVYFLYQGDEIVYVGQSTCVWRRIYTHKQEGIKEFDSYSVLPCEESKLQETELFYIFALQPKYNKSLGGFCNKRTFIKKIKNMFDVNLKKRDIEKAMKELGIESYLFKGVEYFRSGNYPTVGMFIAQKEFCKKITKKAELA